MVEPVTPLSVALKLAPYAHTKIQQLIDANEPGNLREFVRKDLRRSHVVPGESRDAVAGEWNSQAVDPTLTGSLTAWLATGHEQFVEHAGERWRELLDGAPPIDLEPAQLQQVVEVTLESVRRHLAEAKADDRTALYAESERTRHEIRGGFAGVTEHISEAIEQIDRIPRAWRAEDLKLPTDLALPSEVGERLVARVRRALERAATANEQEAAQLAEVWQASGPDGVESLIEHPQAWFEGAHPDVWVAAGRIALHHGRPDAAQAAFLHAADDSRVEDRPRQFVRASTAALHANDDEAAARHLQTARDLDDTNAAVLLRDARSERDPDARLKLLEQIQSDDPDQLTEITVHRASTFVVLHQADDAREELNKAENFEPDGLLVREARARIVLTQGRVQRAGGERPDTDEVRQAATDFHQLREDLLLSGGQDVAGEFAALEAQAWLLVEEHPEARQVLEEQLPQVGDLSDETAALLAEIALQGQWSELAIEFARDRDDEQLRLYLAEAHVQLEDDEFDTSLETVRHLRQTADDSTVRSRAAFVELLAATVREDVEWDPEAAEMVSQDRAWLPALLEAQQLAEAGKFTEAKDLLLPHSDRPAVLRTLRDVASAEADQSDDWAKAIRLSERILAGRPDDSDYLRHAALLRHNGDASGAVAVLLTLARGDKIARAVRREAYRAVAAHHERHQHLGDLVDIGDEWFDFAAEDREAAWIHLYALLRLTRVEEAFDAWQRFRDAGLQTETEREGLLIAQMYDWQAPTEEALPTIADLSDRHERPERLEYALIVGALRRGDADLAPELEERLKESLNTFTDRFPESTLLQAIPVDPENPGASLIDFLEQYGDPGDNLREMEADIASGETPVSVLAALTSKSVSATWLRLSAMPLRFPDADLHEQDQADAAHALDDAAAVWDAATVHLVGGLGEPLRTALMNALPASRIAQATLDDAASALNRPVGDVPDTDRFGNGEAGLVVRPDDPRFRVRDQARSEGVLELARSFPAPERPASLQDEDPRIEELLGEESTTIQLATFVETLLIASRAGLPVFSDDRRVRQTARQLGLRAFDTLGLLGAMAARGLIEESALDEARMQMLRTGAWGIRPTGDELVQLARESHFKLSHSLAMALLDRLAVRFDTVATMRGALRLLEVVSEEHPEDMNIWLRRVIDALGYFVPEKSRGEHATNLMVLALDPAEELGQVSDTCVRALAQGFRELPLLVRRHLPADVLRSATNFYLGVAGQVSKELQARVFQRIVSRFDGADHDMLMRTFVSD